MMIAVEALFNSPNIEQAVLIFERDDTLFADIIDFMNNHKSDEYVSLSVDDDYVKVSSGKYHTIRRLVKLPDILTNFYSTSITLPKKPLPVLQNAKMYANRYGFYFYGDFAGVIYQSQDITREMIKQWCKEMANV